MCEQDRNLDFPEVEGPDAAVRALPQQTADPKNHYLMLFAFLACLLSQTADARPPSRFRIILPPMPVSARFMGVDLHNASGRVAATTDCPAGWQIQVDNDVAWRATLSAHATVGAAALDPDAFASSPLLTPAASEIADTLNGTLVVTGSATIIRRGSLMSIDLHRLVLVRVAPRTDAY